MAKLSSLLAAQSDFGYLLIRLVTGIILLVSGYNKIFNMGFAGVGEMFGKINIILPTITGPFIGLLEIVGGIGLIVGLFTRVFGLLFAIEFVVATYTTWITLARGYQGSRLEILLLVAGLLFATHGGGKYSVDKGRSWA
jgi:putative oxidoreductase